MKFSYENEPAIALDSTELDRLFLIHDRDFTGKVDLSAENMPVVAAAINSSLWLTLGSESGILTELEMNVFTDSLEGGDNEKIHTRFTWDKNHYAEPRDFIINKNQDRSIGMVTMLQAFDDTDPTFAENLIPYLGKELMVDRSYYGATSVRPDEKVKSTIELLLRLGNEASGKEQYFNLKLAGTLMEVHDKFIQDRERIIEETAASKVTEHRQEWRKKRLTYRAAGAFLLVMAGAAIPAGFVDQGSNHTKAMFKATADKIDSTVSATRLFLSEDPKNSSIILQNARQIVASQQKSIRGSEHGHDGTVQNKLAQMAQDAKKVLADEQVTSQEVHLLDQEHDQIDLLSSKSDKTLPLMGITMAAAFGMLGILSIFEAEGRGGRRDRQLAAYKAGKLPVYENTPSLAVNSSRRSSGSPTYS